MYQDDDRTDAEAAVTVTLASATQATIGALGSTGVGHRITQGSVVAWLTAALGSAAYTTTATLANGAATAAAPMTCVVEWNASPTPGTMSHWRQMRAQFSSILVQAWRVRFGFTSERVQSVEEVYQDFTSTADGSGRHRAAHVRHACTSALRPAAATPHHRERRPTLAAQRHHAHLRAHARWEPAAMRLLPRSFEYRSGDTAESVGTRLAIWTRDVIAAFKRIPDVTYIEVPVASGGSVDVESAERHPLCLWLGW
jgi:hypothetical protein